MNSQIHIRKSNFKTGLIIILSLVAIALQRNVLAQVKIDSSALILVDTLKFDAKTHGILSKIIQPIKFKDNRDRREKKRIYDFMQELIHNGQLQIDSSTVYDIMVQLDTIYSTNTSTKKIIDDIIATNELDKKASEEVVESLKTKMSAVILENASNNIKEKRALMTDVNKDLKEIRKVKYSYTSGKGKRDTFPMGDTLYFIERVLNPKIKVIGWHNSWIKDEYLRYNYNYLSSINLYGYELSPTGKNKKPEYIDDFKKPGGIIESAQDNGCDVHLTVYSKLPSEIRKFLNDTIAQNNLIAELNTIINNNNLKGINVYFDGTGVADAPGFVQFISKVRVLLNSIDKSYELNITLPAIVGDASLSEIGAYDFSNLNPLVDYYLVLTDRMVGKNVKIAQSASPLFNSKIYGNRSIESTFGIYSQVGIPLPKLIMTVSYLGVEWKVNDFSGDLQSAWGKDIKYTDILKKYSINTNGRTITEGFDPDQVAPFLNVIDQGSDNLKQIWFEDSRSLYLKYNWALENELGGVSIRGLGYDDGYPELWNVLGASLLEIDTVWVGLKSTKVDTTAVELTFSDYLKVFIEDFKWAVAVDLEYLDSTSNPIICDCMYNEDTIKKYIHSPIIWRQWQPYKSKSIYGINENVLRSSNLCSFLFTRWDIYASIFRWCWTISLILIVVFYLSSLQLERYKLGKGVVLNTIKIGQGLSFIAFVLAICFWLYLSPSVELIGAASEGSNIGILFISLFFGGFLGWLLNSWYNKNKRIPKNLP